MRRKYKNSPIVEALCEFLFTPSQPWDITLSGNFYDKVKENFPDKIFKVNLSSSEFKMMPQEITNKVSLVFMLQFFNKNGTAVVQLGKDLLSINRLKPYKSWEEFKPIIVKSLSAYQSTFKPQNIRRIRLRFINKIDFETEEFEIKKYFKYYPYFSSKNEKKNFTNFATKVEIPLKMQDEKILLTLGTTIPNEENTTSILLDIDYIFTPKKSINVDSILDQAHKTIDSMFENCITDQLRDKFGGVVL